MKASKKTLYFIFVVTILSLVFSLPENVPLRINNKFIKINRVINPPEINIPFLGINKKISTHLGLDLLGGTQLVLEADMSKVTEKDRVTAHESVKNIIDRRVNFYGVAEPVVQTAKVGDSYRVIVELPGIKDINQATATIGQTAQLEFRELIEEEGTQSAVFPTLKNTKSVNIDGRDLKKAEVAFDPNTGQPMVAFELTDEGGKKFAEVSTRLVGKRLAIFLDSSILSAPVVKTPITEGKGSITGNFTRDEAKNLALNLSAGALPVPIKIIEQRNIGATLGNESVIKSVRAGFFGLTIVALFMLVYYGYLGLIADIALVIYGLISFSLFRLIPVTLTLPGIAGFILSIGMAVDSNILIFSRTREELRKGKPWHMAMEIGFGKAWDSIRDANFTTLITAFILYNPLNWNFFPASGMVRGFALTLAIGVIVSLFTGIVVSRNLIRAFYKPKIINN